MVKMSKFVNSMRDYVFARSVIPILLISLGAAAVIAGCVSIVIVKRNGFFDMYKT